ncbi:MAG TPA: isoprenylcysteine carboxylmethyltransferase family protein [Terriglobales bacterium]|jgi:protein-S-isoprenylcysteine O-methyltransferase Ste14
MPNYGYTILAVGWVVWMIPFFLVQRKKQTAAIVDRRARWGLLLIAIAYSLLWQGKFWLAQLPPWRLALSICFLVSAGALSWSGAQSLGRHWRVDAALNSDHQLVTSGPYRFVRHPIYASMFSILLGTGFMITSKWLFIAAVALFIAGTEIRVRIEESLLGSRFGDEFVSYRSRVAAYIPFVR